MIARPGGARRSAGPNHLRQLAGAAGGLINFSCLRSGQNGANCVQPLQIVQIARARDVFK